MSLYDGGGYLKIDFKIVMISWLKKPRNIQVSDINPKPHSSGILGGGGGSDEFRLIQCYCLLSRTRVHVLV